MRAIELITDIIPPLVHNDTGEKALIWMEEFKVSHLPVLKNGSLLYFIFYFFINLRLDNLFLAIRLIGECNGFVNLESN